MLYLCLCVCMCIIQRGQWQPTPVFLTGGSHGPRSLAGCSPWGLYELDTTERLHFHVSLSCIGEGNGNPLQRSCLENPRDGGAWWAAVCGVTQGWTRLKRLSSSSRSGMFFILAYYPQVFMSWLYKWGNLKCSAVLFCALNLWSLCRPAVSSVGMMGVIFSPTTLFLVSSSHSACDGYPWMPQFTGLYLKD